MENEERCVRKKKGQKHAQPGSLECASAFAVLGHKVAPFELFFPPSKYEGRVVGGGC